MCWSRLGLPKPLVKPWLGRLRCLFLAIHGANHYLRGNSDLSQEFGWEWLEFKTINPVKSSQIGGASTYPKEQEHANSWNNESRCSRKNTLH